MSSVFQEEVTVREGGAKTPQFRLAEWIAVPSRGD